MRLKGEAYSERLEDYSDYTLYLISRGRVLPREEYQKCRDITTNSELNEEEVQKRLKEILDSNSMKTEQ